MKTEQMLIERLDLSEAIIKMLKTLRKKFKIPHEVSDIQYKCQEIVENQEVNLTNLLYASDYTRDEIELQIRRDVDELVPIGDAIKHKYGRFTGICLDEALSTKDKEQERCLKAKNLVKIDYMNH
jgi:hypothetical protein